MKSYKDIVQQLDEVLTKSTPAGTWIKDFVDSDNPKFAGKSPEKRKQMALAAYYSKQKEQANESAAASQNSTAEVQMNEDHLVHVNDGSKYDEQPHEKDVEHVMSGVKKHGGENVGLTDKGVLFKFKHHSDAHNFISHVNKCPHRSCDAHMTESVDYEEVEQIDEISKQTLGNYVKKSHDQLMKHTSTVNFKQGRGDDDSFAYAHDPIAVRKTANRTKGLNQAVGKLTKESDEAWAASQEKKKEERLTPKDQGTLANIRAMMAKQKTPVKEEAEQIDELSKTTLQSYRDKAAKDVGRAYAIHQDPYKKTNKDDMRKLSNRVKGDERAEIGLKKEDIQLDEISKKTLASYIPKAAQSSRLQGQIATDFDNKSKAARNPQNKASYERLHMKYKNKAWDREDNIAKAANKLAKEEVEQIEEISKKTLGSYVTKAHNQTVQHASNKAFKQGRGDKDQFDFASQYERKDTNRNKGIATAVKKLAKEEVQIDEISKSTLARYIPSAARDVGSHTYAGKEHGEWANHYTKAGDWAAAEKHSKGAHADFKKANKRIAGIDKATKKLATQKEEVQIEEATVKTGKYSWGTMKTVHHGASFSIPLHPEHHQPIAKLKHGESHSFKDETGAKWKATRDNDTVHFSGNTGKTSVKHSDLQESRGHKVIATFLKNREIAQRAYNGNPAKDAEVAQGGGTPADQGIAAAKKDAEDRKKKLSEDQYTAEYKVKQYVDPVTGENKTRKIRPHRVNFKASKMDAKPAQTTADMPKDEKWTNLK